MYLYTYKCIYIYIIGYRHSKVSIRIAILPAPPRSGPVLTVWTVQVRFVDWVDWVDRVDLFPFQICPSSHFSLSDLSFIKLFLFRTVIVQICPFIDSSLCWLPTQ